MDEIMENGHAKIDNSEDELWGIRWTSREDGYFEQELLLPYGRVIKTGLIAQPVKSAIGNTEVLVCIASARSLH